ncbi:hypothetical protein K4K61_011111 [Colletotrichum sp. SAR11_59]|nr:hypothetical protein K4K61_011111 [Colletotrichum sp. SAR11_59]
MQNKQARRELRSYLEENNLINLFPGVVPGYALRSRKWVLLDLDVLQYVQHSDEDEIVKWAKVNWESLQWNGRQIRNAFQTAIALAEFKAQSKDKARRTGKVSSSPTPSSPKRPVLSQDTFMLIAEASIQFNDYLLQTHGGAQVLYTIYA